MKVLKNFYAKKDGIVKFYPLGSECDADKTENLVRLGLVEKPKRKPRKKVENKDAAPKNLEDK